MPAPHHLLIPYAASRAPGAQEALKSLALPHVDRLLTRLSTADASPGEETSLTPPHERALAQALGLGTEDGLIPWAAWHRLQQGQPIGQTPDESAWAFITPCQWQVTTDHITLHDPAHLGLDEAASRELLAIVAPWFAEDGITLHYDQPTRWLASSPLFATLATASLERVQGRDVRAWMPNPREARTLHRLQSEMQMLLYTHPFNDARTAQGLPAVHEGSPEEFEDQRQHQHRQHAHLLQRHAGRAQGSRHGHDQQIAGDSLSNVQSHEHGPEPTRTGMVLLHQYSTR